MFLFLKQNTMRLKILYLIVIAFIPKCAISQDNIKPYVVGENLVYVAHFGWLNAGKATFYLNDSIYKKDSVFHAKALAKTIGLADKVFKVRDIYESFFNKESGLPYLAIRNINEGSYKYYNEVEYNHRRNHIISQKSGKQDVPENILDMVSAFYFFREMLISKVQNIGDEVILDTYFSDEIFPLKMRYVGNEKIKTKLGKFNCMKFTPVVEPGRIFDSEDDVTIWFSTDQNHVPIQIRIDLIIGSIKADLIEYSGLKYPLK